MEAITHFGVVAMSVVLTYYAAALLHESAHALAGELLDLPAKGFRFSWGSVAIVRSQGTPLSNLLVSAAGPSLSLLVAGLVWPYLHLFALANFCLGVANLIPVLGSDGDRILGCMEALGWIEPVGGRRHGLAVSHAWLRSLGFSDWDLGQMELAEECSPAPGLLSLPKILQELFVTTCDI